MRKTILVLAALLAWNEARAQEAPDSAAAYRAAVKSPDPLLAYTNAMHEGYDYGEYIPAGRAALRTAKGTAGIVGFTNTTKAPHATWGNVWYLVTPQGGVFEIVGLVAPGDFAGTASFAGHPAVAILSGDMHQGNGNEATTLLFHDGRDYRFHTEDHRFQSSGDSTLYDPVAITDGKLVLKPLPAALAKKLARPFPVLARMKPRPVG
jgi:hypothetical protein